jgi:hypothetical protein
MEVLVTKIRSLDPNKQGLIPVGYKVSGTLVDIFGQAIKPTQIKDKGLQLRLPTTKFSEKPYQFAADAVQIVKEVNKDFQVYTVSSIYLVEII